MDSSNAPVTRGALERVLARAAELQAAGGDALEQEAFTEAQLIDLGKEVGLAPDHLRQALAEERARGEPVASEEGRLSEYLLGSSRVSAQRVVAGAPTVVMERLGRWMQNEEWMRVVRQRPDRMVWEPRRDLLGGLRRVFGGRSHKLHVATEVAASAAAVDAGRTVVALVADLSGARRSLVGQAIAGTTFGAAATGVLTVLGFMTVIAVAPVAVLGLGSLYGTRRAGTLLLLRTHTALEQVLDRLEQRAGEPPAPSLLKAIESALPRGL